jgi:hypothetical protein
MLKEATHSAGNCIALNEAGKSSAEFAADGGLKFAVPVEKQGNYQGFYELFSESPFYAQNPQIRKNNRELTANLPAHSSSP